MRIAAEMIVAGVQGARRGALGVSLLDTASKVPEHARYGAHPGGLKNPNAYGTRTLEKQRIEDIPAECATVTIRAGRTGRKLFHERPRGAHPTHFA